MSDEKVLTKEIAEQFVADEDSVDLSECTAIDDDAAEVLAIHIGNLYLSGISTLTDSSAISLGKHKGDLDLSGVSCLSNAAILSLVQHKGEINLESLEEVNAECANAISTSLSRLLLSVDEFSEEVQAILNVHPCFRLNQIDLEEWLLAELGFELENDGDDWLHEELTEALETAADQSYSWDDEDNQWFGTDIGYAPFEEGFSLVLKAWRTEIHTVMLYDKRKTQLVFFGELEEIQADLQPILGSARPSSANDDES